VDVGKEDGPPVGRQGRHGPFGGFPRVALLDVVHGVLLRSGGRMRRSLPCVDDSPMAV